MSQVTRGYQRDWSSTTNSTTVEVFSLQFIPLNPPEPIKTRESAFNEETARVIREARVGKNVIRCKSADDMLRKLGI